jgi:hypothetical protein
MKHSTLRICTGLVIGLTCISGRSVGGQLTYARGQNVVAAFDGWERHADGTFGMVFSYYNRNYEESLDIPIGPDNNIQPGPQDQGQPTHFLPGRQKFVFSVTVPATWDKNARLVWTLTVRGKTEKANAFLLPEWEINNQVRAQNYGDGAGGGGVAPDFAINEAPQISMGPAQSVALSESVTLTAFAKDDGLPKPRARRGASTSRGAADAAPPAAPASQLRVTWVMYRGPAGATVRFAPERSPVADGKAVTTATFSLPGPYVVRGYADDGAVTAPADLSVTVSGTK